MRNKWVLLLILGLGMIPFLGASLVPIIGELTRPKQPTVQVSPTPQPTTAPTPSPTAGPSINPEVKALQEQERGFTAVLKKEPDNATALEALLETRLQLVQLGQAKVEDAIEPLAKLAKLRPENSKYQILLGQAYAQTGNREAAAAAFRRVLAVKPGDTQALQALAGLFLQENRPEAAMGLLQDTLKSAPKANQLQPGSVDVPSVRLLVVSVYAAQQRFDEATALLDQLIKDHKTDFRPLVAKAEIRYRQGNRKEAQSLLQAAIPLAPPQVKDQLKANVQKLAQLNQPQAPSPTPSPSVSPNPADTAPLVLPLPSATPLIPIPSSTGN